MKTDDFVQLPVAVALAYSMAAYRVGSPDDTPGPDDLINIARGGIIAGLKFALAEVGSSDIRQTLESAIALLRSEEEPK